MQPAPSPPVVAQQPQPMQPMAAYQPQPKFLEKYGAYSFQRWLMVGVILVVAAAILTEIPNLTGEPIASDYDDVEKEKISINWISTFFKRNYNKRKTRS